MGWITLLLKPAAATLFGGVVFAITLRLGIPSANGDIDRSWSAVLAWAHANDRHWGTDIVFTYGPLGYLNGYASYDPAVFEVFLRGQLLLGLGCAGIFVLALRALRSGYKLLLLATLLLAPWLHTDAAMFACATLALAVMEQAVRTAAARPWQSAATSALVATYMAAVSLLKFSLLPLGAALGAIVALRFLQQRQWRQAPFWLFAGASAFLGLWLGNGQPWDGLDDYLFTSLELVGDYAAAMGSAGSDVQLQAGLAVLGGCIVLLAGCGASRRGERAAALAGGAYLLLVLLIAWRAGFVRADAAHVSLFFVICCFVPVVLAACSGPRTPAWPAAAPALALPLLLVIALQNAFPQADRRFLHYVLEQQRLSLYHLLHPGQLRAAYDMRRGALLPQLELPRMRAAIGDARVDLFMTAQGLLLANGFHYAPRPVFQSYAAYTPALLRMNQAHFLGPAAPDFVIFKFEPIDLRYPSSEDAPALLALLRHYRPLEQERGFLLLRRDAAAQAAAAAAPALQPLPVGEWLAVPDDDAVVAYLHWHPGPAARLLGLVLRDPPLQIEVELSDGSIRRHRLIPASAAGGFLLSPFFDRIENYVQWYYDRGSVPQVRRLRLNAEAAGSAQIAFAPAALARGSGEALPASIAEILYPGLGLAPRQLHGLTQPIVEHGQPALLLHAVAAADFDLPPRAQALEFTYGLSSNVLSTPECAGNDGIRVSVARLRGDSTDLLFARELAALRQTLDRGPQRQRVPLPPAESGDRLRIAVGLGNDDSSATCDWGYLRDVGLHPADAHDAAPADRPAGAH